RCAFPLIGQPRAIPISQNGLSSSANLCTNPTSRATAFSASGPSASITAVSPQSRFAIRTSMILAAENRSSPLTIHISERKACAAPTNSAAGRACRPNSFMILTSCLTKTDSLFVICVLCASTVREGLLARAASPLARGSRLLNQSGGIRRPLQKAGVLSILYGFRNELARHFRRELNPLPGLCDRIRREIRLCFLFQFADEDFLRFIGMRLYPLR